MRAIYFDGDNPQLKTDYPDPTPVAGEAIIRPILAGVCSTDLEICRGYMGFQGVLGHEFVGIVESVADSGDQQWVGKRVVGTINATCGRCDMCERALGTHCRDRTVLGIFNRDGCFSDRFQLPVANLIEVDESISDDQAVFTEPLAAACQALRDLQIESGKTTVTILGDGRLGLLVAQVVAHAGAVTQVVGKHEAKLALCRGWGIKSVLLDQFNAAMDQDMVIDCTASAKGLELALRTVRPRGQVVLKTTVADQMGVDLSPIVINEIQVIGSRCGPFPEALGLLAANQIDTQSLIGLRVPIVDACHGLTESRSNSNIKVLLEFDS